jgi:predicted nucleic acid-binding protein
VSAVFANTFYWIALTAPGDAAHERARRFKSNIVTTEEVLGEYLNFFCEGPQELRHRVSMVVEAVLANPDIRVVPQTHESFRAGFDLYRARPDKGYSLTDCISMQTMRREGLSEALTNDRHFEQEGFRALFR